MVLNADGQPMVLDQSTGMWNEMTIDLGNTSIQSTGDSVLTVKPLADNTNVPAKTVPVSTRRSPRKETGTGEPRKDAEKGGAAGSEEAGQGGRSSREAGGSGAGGGGKKDDDEDKDKGRKVRWIPLLINLKTRNLDQLL